MTARARRGIWLAGIAVAAATALLLVRGSSRPHRRQSSGKHPVVTLETALPRWLRPGGPPMSPSQQAQAKQAVLRELTLRSAVTVRATPQRPRFPVGSLVGFDVQLVGDDARPIVGRRDLRAQVLQA